MSIYSKQVADLTFSDIHELQAENAQENIRLEFKGDFPGKAETLKKVSSMANTYGGYIVIGAQEDGKGNLTTLDGVLAAKGNKQTLIQWCYDGISPPLMPFVKEIPHNDNPTKVFYVIYVEESFQAPHFINNRKGCYIRTDEFSQRFEPRLATYEELRFLLNRRQESLSLREEIIARAHARFERNSSVNYGQKLRHYSTMSLAIAPFFPGPFSLEVNDLEDAIRASQLRARGTLLFPGENLRSALGSFYHPDPRAKMAIAYFEASVHGLLFFGQGLVDRASPTSDKKLYSNHTIGWLIFYLKYANVFYRNAGYDGALYVQLHFDRLEGTKFVLVHPQLSKIGDGKQLATELDDTIHITIRTDTKMLQNGLTKFTRDLVRRIGFAFGWAEVFAVDDPIVDVYIDQARQYLKLEEESSS